MFKQNDYNDKIDLTLVAFLPFVGPTFDYTSGILSKYSMRYVGL